MQNNEDSTWLPSQNENDEELPQKQRLDAESEVTDTPPAPSVEHGKGMAIEDVTEPGHLLHEARHLAIEKPDMLKRRGIDEKYIQLMKEIAKESIQKKEVKIKAILDLKFYTGDGVRRVKEFLNSLQDKYKWEIKYISAPRYSIEITTKNPKKDEKEFREKLTEEVSRIKNGEASFKIRGK